MAQVIRTADDNPYEVELAGVGRMNGNGKGGIPVEFAAQYVRELQDVKGQPLTGSKLSSAAKKFAESRGLVIDNVKDLDEEKLRVEGGAFPAGLSIEEVSRAYTERMFAQVPADELARNPEPESIEVEEVPPALDQPMTDRKA